MSSKNSNSNKKDIIVLALLVGILPPAWAVASPYLHISVGPIALIAAGIYGANGNQFRDAKKITLGYLAGDLWGYISTIIMTHTPYNADISLFATLFVLGILVVLISNVIPGIFYMPSWLAGWAIAMLTFNLDTQTNPISLLIQIGIAMIVGVYYVGALLDKIHRIICRNAR